MFSPLKFCTYGIIGSVFGPGAALFFNVYGDFYSLSKIWPIFDIITEEWLLLLGFFIFWVGFYYMLAFWYELLKYLNRPPNLDWWQKEVIYQIYIKSFYDSNNDGYGDLKGVTDKLDYLQKMGIKSIWLTPFYPSGGKDGGYDITSYNEIDPIYGNMKDFDELIEKAHGKDMHVIMDFVPNHTSNNHNWFKESSKSNESSNPYRDYYVWYESEDSVNPPNNWLSVFGQSAWTYSHTRRAWYLHQFLKEQPDLNFRCAAVRDEMKIALSFWLETKNVDGFRIDAFKHIFESNEFKNEPTVLGKPNSKDLTYDDLEHIHTSGQKETYELLNDWKDLFSQISERTKSTKAMIVECSYTKTAEIVPYYKYKNKKMAHFPFNFQFVGINKKLGNELTSKSLKSSIEDYLAVLPNDCWANWQIGNHDTSRASTRIGTENINIANTLNLLLGGTALIYYGEEIGMEDLPTDLLSFENSKDEFGKKYGPDEFIKYSRDFSRTPMQWNNDKNSGFTKSTESWLPVNPNYSNKNVKMQLEDNDSHLQTTIKLLKLREQASFQWGKLKLHVINEQIFSFTRKAYDFPSYLVVLNISDKPSKVILETSSEIAPRAYVSCYISGGKSNSLDSQYQVNAPVLTKNVSLNPRDCLVLMWRG